MNENWIDYLSNQWLPHRQLEHYLKLTGWSQSKKLNDATSYINLTSKYKKFIPTNSSYEDYTEGLLFVISELSHAYKKDLDEFILDIFEKAEVFRFRFDSNLAYKQNLSLQEFSDFSKSMLSALSKASKEIDSTSKNRKIRSNELVESCQIGQTQPGSYIVKLFIPQINIEVSNLKPEEKRVVRPLVHRYQRFVSEKLYTDYSKLLAFSNEIKKPETDEEIDFFLTKNINLGKTISAAVESDNSFLEIQPKWSGWIKPEERLLDALYFESKNLDWLPEKLAKIKKRELSKEKFIIGFVLHTSRNLDSDGKNMSDPYIRIRYKDELGKDRIARLEATEEQYSQALEAAKPGSIFAIGLKARITRRPKVDLIFKEHISAFELHKF